MTWSDMPMSNFVPGDSVIVGANGQTYRFISDGREHIPGVGWVCCRILHGLEEVRCLNCGGWRHPDADVEVAARRVAWRVRRSEERAAA